MTQEHLDKERLDKVRVENASRERLDHYLVRTGLAASRRVAQELVERGMVRINGRYPRKSDVVGADDSVEVKGADGIDDRVDRGSDNPHRVAPLKPDSSIAIKIDIVHQDAAVIVANKPGAIPCHPLRSDELGTVMNAIVARFPDTASAGDKPLEGGLVHRLDNGTSGALLIARNRNSFAKLRDAVRSSKISRRYEALVAGHLERKITIDTPIAHHPKNPRKMIVGDPSSGNPKRAGRAASTTVEPLRRVGDFTLVSIAPKTGSRHQIRVHLASVGLPIVGDTLYGGPESAHLAHGRFWLHLCDIAFDSPAVGHVKAIAAPPPDLKALLD